MTSEASPNPSQPWPRLAREGLCPACLHVREVRSERGSRFWMCTLAKQDPSLPRYPPQPRHLCHAFRAAPATR